MQSASAVALTAMLVTIPTVAHAAPLEGKVILTRVATAASPDALIVWDATDRVVTLETAKTPADDILKTLEAESATAATSLAESIGRAKAVSVRVIYQRIGAISPAYGSASLQGVERLVVVTFPAADLAAKAASYADALAKGTTPAGVKVNVTGKLPT